MLKNRTKKGLKKLKEFSSKIGYQAFIFIKQKKTSFKDVFYIYLKLIPLFANPDKSESVTIRARAFAILITHQY